MERKPINCIGKRTRSNTMDRVLATHRQTSEMHRAISLRDKNRVKRLLDKGQKLCNGVGINCFILAQSVCKREFLQYLLSVDPYGGVRAKDYQGHTLLMLYSKSHKLKEAQLMLELGADANDCSNDGETALMLAVRKLYFDASYHGRGYNFFRNSYNYSFFKSHRKDFQGIVDLLLQNGADVNIRNTGGENVLHTAVRNTFTFNLQILQTLINAGVDPTTEDREHCTVLSLAMEQFTSSVFLFDMDTVINELYPSLLYLLGLAAFRRDTFQLRCLAAKHPQSILLKRLNVTLMLTRNTEIFADLIANNKNLMNSELVVFDYFQSLNNDTMDVSRIEHIERPFGPVAYYLNYEQSYVMNFNPAYRYNPIENLQHLLSAGLTLNTQFHETLSPLTVGLLNYSLFETRGDYETFARVLMANGAHVEQRLLMYDEVDEELNQLSAALCLPDVLRVALSQNHLDGPLLELLKMFLPHFAHPPLALLPFARQEIISKLFQFLSLYGTLHHSPVHKTVKERILNTHCLSNEELYTFNSMNNSIPLLQDLCSTAVRVHLAPRASQQGNCLPGLIREIHPLAPGLRTLLLNVTPK